MHIRALAIAVKIHALHESGRTDEALLAAVEGLREHPDKAILWNNYAAILLAKGNIEKALAAVNRALETEPLYEKGWHTKALILEAGANIPDAEKAFDQLATLNPRDLQGITRGGGNPDNVERALHLNPHYRSVITQAFVDELRESLGPSDSTSDNDWRTYSALADLLMDSQRYEEALSIYEKLLLIQQPSAELWVNKGHCLYELGRYDEAIRCFHTALEVHPGDWPALMNLSRYYLFVEDYKSAETSARLALAQNDRSDMSWNNLGCALLYLDMDEDGAAALRRSLEINPNNSRAWFNLGSIRFATGDHASAAPCFAEALRLNPRFEEAQEFLLRCGTQGASSQA